MKKINVCDAGAHIRSHWIPAFAGMTALWNFCTRNQCNALIPLSTYTNTKKSPFGDFLICRGDRDAFAARTATTIQNVASALGRHARAKTMRANTTCF